MYKMGIKVRMMMTTIGIAAPIFKDFIEKVNRDNSWKTLTVAYMA